MERLQKKCLAASAITHGLLLAMLVVGSAFLPQKPPEPAASISLVNLSELILVDEPNVAGGGNPSAAPPQRSAPPPAPPVQQPVIPEPASLRERPQPEKPREPAPEPARQPEIKPAEPKHEPKAESKRESSRIKPEDDKFKLDKLKERAAAKAEQKFDLSKAEHKTIRPAAAPSERGSAPAAGEKQLAAASSALSEAMKRVQGNLSQATGNLDDVFGAGGPAYASYNLVLRKIYEDAWIPPAAARGKEPIVEAEVTIARNGRVLSARIIKPAGRAQLDASVKNVLDRVKNVPPFPSGVKDEQRTFRINFNLSDKLRLE